MRCGNCGWENQPNATVCSKCGRPLSGASQPASDPAPMQVNTPDMSRATRIFTPGSAPMAEPINRETRVITPGSMPTPEPINRETRVITPGSMPTPEPVQRETRRVTPEDLQEPTPRLTRLDGVCKCPRCGNPVDEDATMCLQCGTILKESKPEEQAAPKPQAEEQKPVQAKALEPAPEPEKAKEAAPVEDDVEDMKKMLEELTVTCPKCGAEVSLEFDFCPKCGKRMPKNTIDPRRLKKKAKKEEPAEPEKPVIACSLTLIPEEGEPIEAQKLPYEGEKIVLTRMNTEPMNRTITSKEQASLTFENGHWFVENLSALESTFIQVTRKMELQPGDILLLGNRRFQFGCEQPDKPAAPEA